MTTYRVPLVVLLAAAGLLWGYRAAKTPYYQSPSAASPSLDALLEELDDGASVSARLLGKGASVSHHLVRVRSREGLHRHNRHDLTVVLVRGAGDLVLHEKPLRLEEGAVAFIPRRTPHEFVNTGRQDAVLLALFTPAYDGKDREALE